MRFRRPPRQKWLYPIILCSCATLGFVVVTSNLPRVEKLGAGLWVLALSACCAYWSWEAWTARVDVDEEGVRWKEGGREGGLLWEEISGLSRNGAFLEIVERSSEQSVPLPFVTRPLYGALARRLRPLKVQQERALFSELPVDD